VLPPAPEPVDEPDEVPPLEPAVVEPAVDVPVVPVELPTPPVPVEPADVPPVEAPEDVPPEDPASPEVEDPEPLDEFPPDADEPELAGPVELPVGPFPPRKRHADERQAKPVQQSVGLLQACPSLAQAPPPSGTPGAAPQAPSSAARR